MDPDWVARVLRMDVDLLRAELRCSARSQDPELRGAALALLAALRAGRLGTSTAVQSTEARDRHQHAIVAVELEHQAEKPVSFVRKDL